MLSLTTFYGPSAPPVTHRTQLSAGNNNGLRHIKGTDWKCADSSPPPHGSLLFATLFLFNSDERVEIAVNHETSNDPESFNTPAR